ncbi:LOW QUALITY PROTEIN: hypothetical protein HJC23_001115, partial [Cyclotella cryptica]
ICPTDGHVQISPRALTKASRYTSRPIAHLSDALHTPQLCKTPALNTAFSLSNRSDNDNRGLGIVTAIFACGVLLFFAVSAFAPPLEEQPWKLGRYSTRWRSDEKLREFSRAKIQLKLSNLPVFYLVSDRKMNEKIFFSFSEAEAVSKEVPGATSPLILKHGKIQSASTPQKILQAQESLSELSFTLVPSTTALKDAKATEVNLKENDVPLFVVDRLAFASNKGPQVPLFLERNDAIISYNRLRESGANTLPAEPNIRTTSLLDVLDSMERGTKPGVTQLQFYGNADDVLKADEMST